MNTFKQLRYNFALVSAAAAFVVGGLGSLWYYRDAFSGSERVPIFTGFPGWDMGQSTCNCDASAVEEPESDAPVPLVEAFFIGFADPAQNFQVAWVSRLLVIVVAAVWSGLAYRVLLPGLYAARRFHDSVRREIFSNLRRSVFQPLGAVCVALAAGIIAYVLSSIGWILVADMFEGLALTALAAVIVTALIAGMVGYGVARWSATLTTRGLLGLGTCTFVIGMAGSFAIARNPLWYQGAISVVGLDVRADNLFTGTLIAGACVLAIMWADLDVVLRLLTAKGFVPAKGILVTRLLAIVTTVGLALTGIFRYKGPGIIDSLHALGAGAATVCYIVLGMFVVCWWVGAQLFPKHFKIQSTILGIASLGLLGAIMSNAGASITFIEFVLVASTGWWMFNTVDYVLDFASDHLKDLSPDEIDRFSPPFGRLERYSVQKKLVQQVDAAMKQDAGEA